MNTPQYNIQVIPEDPSVFAYDTTNTRIIDMILDTNNHTQIKQFKSFEEYLNSDEIPETFIEEVYEMYGMMRAVLGDVSSVITHNITAVLYYVLSGMMLTRLIDKLGEKKVKYTADDMKKRV
jgi:hypothetical protein